MGCSIHLYAEKRLKNSEYKYWSPVLDINNLGLQDYDMFGFLANGVRFTPDEKYEPHEVNGLPEDVCFNTIRDTRLRVAGSKTKSEWEGFTTRENAEMFHSHFGCKLWKMNDKNGIPSHYKWVEIDKLPEEDVDDLIDKEDDRPTFWVDNPDRHSHSHISLEEYKGLLFRYAECMNETYYCGETVTETKEGFLVGTTTIYWLALYNLLHTYEDYYEIRLIYWFDS